MRFNGLYPVGRGGALTNQEGTSTVVSERVSNKGEVVPNMNGCRPQDSVFRLTSTGFQINGCLFGLVDDPAKRFRNKKK